MPIRAGCGYVRSSSSRNLGVGRLLLSAMLDVARENVELIQLSVVKETRPARRLYESAGFLEFGVEAKGKSARKDGTLSREDFGLDQANDIYVCPGLTTTGTRGRLRLQ